jgi:hypothetical protein
MSSVGVRRVLTALLSPPFHPKSMSLDISACGIGFIYASHIQRLLRLAAVSLSDNNFMLPPSKTVASGLLAVQRYLQDPPAAASRALESCLSQQLSDVAVSAAAAVVDLIAWQTATTSSVSPGCGLMWCTLLKSRHYPSPPKRAPCAHSPNVFHSRYLQQNSTRPFPDDDRKYPDHSQKIRPVAQPVPRHSTIKQVTAHFLCSSADVTMRMVRMLSVCAA